MRYLAVAVLALAANSTSAQPATDAARCDKAANAIVAADMSIAAIHVDMFLDNSAPREAVRQTKTTNELLVAQMNLNLMLALRCPSIPELPSPIGARFRRSAVACNDASRASAAASTRAMTIAECDRSTWVPASPAASAPR